MRPVIVTIAPTGGSLRSIDHPFVPTTASAIAENVVRCVAAGASVAALHVRDVNEEATCDPDCYREVNELIRSQVDVVLNNSSGGGTTGSMAANLGEEMREISWSQRLSAADASADIITFDAITAWTKPPRPEVLMNTPRSRAKELGRRITSLGLRPEWEVFNPSHITNEIPELIAELGEQPPHAVSICLDLDRVFTNACPWSPRLLEYMVDALPPGSIFTVSTSRVTPWPVLAHAILLGGHVRVGLEDNPWRSDGAPWTNTELVEHVVRLIEAMGERPATVNESREMLGICARHAAAEGAK